MIYAYFREDLAILNMNFSSVNGTSTVTGNQRDTFITAVTKNVIVTALCISINYVNGTQVHTFTKHQVWKLLLQLYMCRYKMGIRSLQKRGLLINLFKLLLSPSALNKQFDIVLTATRNLFCFLNR